MNVMQNLHLENFYTLFQDTSSANWRNACIWEWESTTSSLNPMPWKRNDGRDKGRLHPISRRCHACHLYTCRSLSDFCVHHIHLSIPPIVEVAWPHALIPNSNTWHQARMISEWLRHPMGSQRHHCKMLHAQAKLFLPKRTEPCCPWISFAGR